MSMSMTMRVNMIPPGGRWSLVIVRVARFSSRAGGQAGSTARGEAQGCAVTVEDDAGRPRSELALAVRVPRADPAVRGGASGDVRTEGGVPGRTGAEADGNTGIAADINPK